jgi:APA family basic amino acid/polyamine antiporter
VGRGPGFAGAIAGLIAVILMLLVGQSRIGFAMSRDHLLPPWLAQGHPHYRTPHRRTLLTGELVAVLAALLPIGEIAELVSVGSLLAFLCVSMSIPCAAAHTAHAQAGVPHAAGAVVPVLAGPELPVF